MASGRPPLTTDERAALTSLAELERVTGGQPLRLTNRSVRQVEIPALVFDRIELRDVDFETVRIREARFQEARLDNVSFSACELLGVLFEGGTLSACRFAESHLDKTRFLSCTGAEWQSEVCRFDELGIERSTIEGWTDFHGAFEDAAVVHSQISSLDWKVTRFTRPRWEGLTIAGGKLESVLFENGTGSGVVVRDVSLDGLEVLLGDYAGLTFEAVTGRTLRLTDVQCRGLGLVGCSELSGISAAGLTCAGLIIDRCQPLALLTIGHSEIEALSIADSQIEGIILRGSRIFGESTVTGSELDGFDFATSTLDGATFKDTSIRTLLRMVEAQVRGLKLEGIRYSPDLEVESTGATFSDGDMFPLTGR
jgi:uncharacterized protein YjbI with pentapeptide repeats